VPEFLYYCLDFFLKEQSDILLLYRSIDYRIELIEDSKDLGFSYLSKHSVEELMAIYKYLTDSLAKGFIVVSRVPFISLVLFVYKDNRLL
jgi:hypothetical protein